MAAITIHQRCHGFVWHWKEGPGWWRNPAELRPLRVAGMRVLKFQLEDDGPFPRELADDYRAQGFQVWGMVGHVHEWEHDPEGLAQWLKAERVRLALTGLDLNFEDEVAGFDVRSGGKWSERFCVEARRLMPTVSLHIDSYWGPLGAGINIGAYKNLAGCRFSVQTFWGAEGLWDDPPTNIVQKGAGAQPVIPKALIKPIIRITRNNSGDHVDVEAAIADTQKAGTKGISFYYLDGESDFHTLVLLPKVAIAAGVAY